MTAQPRVFVLAGPNGAGKSTAAAHVLPPGMIFVNADEVAKGLAEYPSRSADIEAGRIVLKRLDELEESRSEFAIETTLSGRALSNRVARLRSSGNVFHLMFVWIPSPELSIGRVAARVRRGGHDIPEATIRRRYASGIKKFFEIYRSMADIWRILDTSRLGSPRVIAEGKIEEDATIAHSELWERIREGVPDE